LNEGKLILDYRRVMGESGRKFWAITEPEQKEFVNDISSFEKLVYGFLVVSELPIHAPACIENDANGERRVFAGEISQALLDVILKDPKSFLLQASHRTIACVNNGYWNLDNCCIRTKGSLWRTPVSLSARHA
jgi:hypothetical protein